MISFYRFSCEYCLDGERDDEVATGIVAADSYVSAVDKICLRLPFAHKISIDEWIYDTDFIFIDPSKESLLDELLEEK